MSHVAATTAPPAPIDWVAGMEPHREGEFPTVYRVGYGQPPVTRIDYRECYYGDHAIGWFDAYAGDVIVGSLQARATSEVAYRKEQTK